MGLAATAAQVETFERAKSLATTIYSSDDEENSSDDGDGSNNRDSVEDCCPGGVERWQRQIISENLVYILQ